MSRFVTLWTVWTLLGGALVYGVSASNVYGNFATVVANVLSLAPQLGLLLALGSPTASQPFCEWLYRDSRSHYYLVGVIILLFSLPGLLLGKFDPYYSVIVAVVASVVFGVLQQHKSEAYRLTWNDMALWLLLWIPLDLRWSMGLLPTAIDAYSWWSISISAVAVIGWNGYRRADIGFVLVPRVKNASVALMALLLVLLCVIPLGLLTGFLSFSIPQGYDFPKLGVHFIGLFLTVALPEELFFRGILLRGLEPLFSNKWLPLLISSAAFGLMHWNNVDTLSAQLSYLLLATIAGIGYGWAYQRSGNTLFVPIMVHTSVDWIWKLFFVT